MQFESAPVAETQNHSTTENIRPDKIGGRGFE